MGAPFCRAALAAQLSRGVCFAALVEGVGRAVALKPSKLDSTRTRVIIFLAACRAFGVRCVVWLDGWMQGAARSQWLFHWQGSQRGRRRPDTQSGGPEAVLGHGRVKYQVLPGQWSDFRDLPCAKNDFGALTKKARQAARHHFFRLPCQRLPQTNMCLA